ncbi:hypothetical protein KBB76_00020 [Candidatus Saccharibacteria bacterium]|jgi:hypothetical protein|nr:hypothetical protein [Candidatus Saccharibacteria bacterium]HOR23368.1 hypothetical protein [Candidatus Saccharibacteria bacterium]HPW47820.1 hypothetical protein [Candidatus Saccharibacteria bacterium]
MKKFWKKDEPKTVSLTFVILVAVMVAIVMVSFTTVAFLKSEAYATVKQIQVGSQRHNYLDEDIDVTSPIKASDIDEYQTSFRERLHSLDDNKDFGPTNLSDENLGL